MIYTNVGQLMSQIVDTITLKTKKRKKLQCPPMLWENIQRWYISSTHYITANNSSYKWRGHFHTLSVGITSDYNYILIEY